MEPIPALEAGRLRFDETVDVLVVGVGVAGASAVVAARQAGAEVLAVERSVGIGGTSCPLGWPCSTWVVGRQLQDACGFEDSPENMAAFLRAALGPGVDDDRINAYCEGSVDHFDWLVSVGVPFRPAFCDEPNRESADDAGLLFSGGEDSYPFDDIAVPVPRGHKPQWIDSAGGFLMECLGKAVMASDARVVADARAEALVVDGEEVVGVQVRTDEGLRAVRARGGVILAAGGFIHNEAMVGRALPGGPCPRRGLADRDPERRRSGDPDGRRRRRGLDQARYVRVRVCPSDRRTASHVASSSTATASASSTRTPTPDASGATPSVITMASST